MMGKSQVLELETLPASVKWKKIKTDHFKIIFPADFELEANRTANILEALYEPGSQSLGVKPRRFPIILQNRNAIPNGFVTILPQRSEFFTTSTQDYNFIGNADWLEFLATHEYRHIVQFEKAYTGIGKVMNWVFGDAGRGFSAVIGAPNWFWEGDAVGLETSLTRGGRGRAPNFTRVFKANLLERGGFNYYKQRHTSFNHFVPNHYVTGYFMTSHLKRKHGENVWDGIIQKSFSFPFIPFSFSNALKSKTGKNLLQTYDGMLTEAKEVYGGQVAKINTRSDEVLLTKRSTKAYTDYKYPSQISDGSIVCQKFGIADIRQFVSIGSNGEEKVLYVPGIVNDPGFLSVRDDKVLWTEFEFDPRWLKQSYSVLKLYDLRRGEFRRLTKKTKYVAAALSPDGNSIVTIENSSGNIYTIHLLDSRTGTVTKKFDNAENAFYSMPSFSDDGKEIVLLKTTKEGKSIVAKDVATGEETALLFSEEENFGHPILYDGYVFYNTAHNGVDNIYALKRSTGEVFQVTSSRYGAYNPSISSDGGEIIYNDHRADGLEVVQVPFDPSRWIPLNEVKDVAVDLHKPTNQHEHPNHLFQNLPNKQYPISRYSKASGLINPFAWGPSYFITTNSWILGVNSQDILSTTNIGLGLLFDASERNWLRFGSISYQGFYPIIDVSVLSGTRSTDEIIEGQIRTFDWEETSANLGLRVPLILTNSKYSRKLSFEAKLRRTRVSDYDNPVPDLAQPGNGDLNALEYKVQFIRQMRRSKRDLYGRFGQTLEFNYRHTPIGGDYFSKLVAVQGNFFFPGLARHHAVRLRGTYQYEDKENYRFRSPVTFTRGFGYISFDQYVNWSFNYKAPLWYPDIHLGPFVNVQRIYANAFYDRGTGIRDAEANRTLQSYGLEASMNFNLMRFSVLFDVGIRYSYLPDFDRRVVELIIGQITF